MGWFKRYILPRFAPLILRLQNQFHHLPHRAAPAAQTSDVIGHSLRLRHTVPHRHRHARALQYPKISQVVAHIADFIPPEASSREEPFHNTDFTALLLQKEIYFQLLGPLHSRGGWPAGNPADLETLAPQCHQAQPVADVELLKFPDPANEYGCISQDPVHVAEEQPNTLESCAETPGSRAAGGGAARKLPTPETLECDSWP